MNPDATPSAGQRLGGYLTSPVGDWPLAAMVWSLALYLILTSRSPYPLATSVALLITGAAIATACRFPKSLVYGLLLLALAVRLYAFTLIVSAGIHDIQSNRDDALELTAHALLRGENAWNIDEEVQATTGPASILLAVPFAATFGDVNALAFVFWLAFAALLLTGDLVHRNQSWPILAGLLLVGAWGVEHTQFWSLEELYFPCAYLGVAYFLALRRWWFAVGVLLSASVLSRPNYVFLAAGFGAWHLFGGTASARSLRSMGLGFLVAAGAIVAPFIIVGGEDFWARNPWRLALDFSDTGWPPTNVVYRALNAAAGALGGDEAPRLLKLALSGLLLGGAAWALRAARIQHPFWHVTTGALIAHTVVWVPVQLPNDYVLMVVLPAMLAVAMTPARSAVAPAGNSDGGTPHG